MNTSNILRGLRDLADRLKPFTAEILPGSRVWNGSAYVPASPRKADPYALAWWGRLTAIADVIERQGIPLTQQQVDYLKKVLFGGMGSFNDFSLDTKSFGNEAVIANRELDKKRSELYGSFQ